MSTVAANPLPRWDLTPAYASLDSEQFQGDLDALRSRTAALSAKVQGAGQDVATLEAVVTELNEISDLAEILMVYVYSLTSTNSRDKLAAARMSELEIALVPLQTLNKQITEWMGSLPIEKLLETSQVALDHRYALEKARVAAKHQMPMAQEKLNSDLSPSGSSAWSKLYDNYTSQIEVAMDVRGETQTMPMSAIRNLSSDPDREVRKSAYEAELASWKSHELTISTCMNAIKGHVLTVCEHRGWSSPLEESLFQANMDQATLDALMSAVLEAQPMFRRYLKTKARVLGLPKMAFFDLFAPVGGEGREWDIEATKSFISRQFHKFSSKLGDMADRSYRENWTDWEPRAGKVGGAYCNPFVGDSSRILLNWKPTFGSGMVLAHELGHAYHNLNLHWRTALQRETPATLSETASIFCETIVKNAAMEELNETEQFMVLEEALQGDCQTIVDVASRFLFEAEVFKARKDRELSADELCELMREAQLKTYGDGLDEQYLHPYMWAAKPHYYSNFSYYNFPYIFGRLFGLGLYAQYKERPEEFKSGYDELLSSTGLDEAAVLAQRFGIDIQSKEFWVSSLAQIGEDIDHFERLAQI